MDTKKQCPQCGKPVSPAALMGLCPDCMFQAAAEPAAAGTTGSFLPPSSAELGAHFPQLEILDLLGRGGMGAVYKARQKELDRLVALKILPPDISHDVAFAERFAREARALAKLNHPHIVTLYEFGRVNGKQTENGGARSAPLHPPLYYFLMEFVDGMNLRELLQNRRMPAREALAIVPEICDALQYAHARGIVHRDIKPANILLSKSGEVKIADFGVAKIITEGSPGTSSGSRAPAQAGDLTRGDGVFGTPAYMAPEQVERPLTVDHRADIYAVGVVLYQMLTGDLPSASFEPPSRRASVDVRLDEVVSRALEKEPGRRYQDAAALKTDVETIAASPSPPVSGAGPATAAGALKTVTAWSIFTLSYAGLIWFAFHGGGAIRPHLSQTGFLAAGELLVGGLMVSALFLLNHFAKQHQKQNAKENNMKNKRFGWARFAVSTGCLAMALTVWIASAQAEDDGAKLTQKGWDLWKARHFEEAAAKFKQAVKVAPKNSEAWNGLGWSSFNSGKMLEAEKAFQKVLSLEPGHPAALNGLGQLYLAQAKYAEAEKILLKAAPQAPAAWYGLARVELLLGKFDEAETWAGKVVDAGGADDVARQMLQAAKDKKISDNLRQQIAPQPAAPMKETVSRAWKMMNEGRRVEARELLQAELQKDPGDANAHNALGWCLLNGGQPQEAKPHFQKAIELDANAAGAMNGLARVYKMEGKVDQAVKLWQEMADKFPGPNAATWGLADTYLERHEYALAIPLFEQIAQANPTDQEIKAKLDRAREGAKQ